MVDWPSGVVIVRQVFFFLGGGGGGGIFEHGIASYIDSRGVSSTIYASY